MTKKIMILQIIFMSTIVFGQQKEEYLKGLYNDCTKEVISVEGKGDVYKITDNNSRRSYYKNLNGYTSPKGLGKTNSSIDTTIIYPDLIDTTQFTGMYEFWTSVPVGTSAPTTIIAGDVNENGKIELYGEKYNSYLNINERSIYEYEPTVNEFIHKDDLPWDDSISFYRDFTQIYDINLDNKMEIFIPGSHQVVDSLPPFHVARVFRLNDSTFMPTELDFEYHQGNQINDPLWGEYDNREGTDLFYCTDGSDLAVAAARYSSSTNSAETVYYYEVPEDIFYLAGLTNQDIDENGYADLSTGGLYGDIVIFEYDENIQNYRDVWHGDGGTYNVYIHFNTNDIDGNGKKEIWAGGAAFYDGVPITRLSCLEATGNNQYETKHVVDIVGRFSFDAYNGFAVDINKDGTEEIGLCLDQTFMIFKFNGEENEWSFELFYLKLNNYDELPGRYHGALMGDLDNDGFEEALIMRSDVFNDNMDISLYTLIFKPTDLVSVKEWEEAIFTYELHQNYPNPFNPSTKISYQISEFSDVRLSVYNILGQEVAVLVSREQKAGSYEVVFDGSGLSSGVYFYRFKATSIDGSGKVFEKTAEMLLLK